MTSKVSFQTLLINWRDKMQQLEKLLKIDFGKKDDEPIPYSETSESQYVGVVYYQDLGFTSAGDNRGSITSYRINVSKLYAGYIEKNKRLKHNTDESDKNTQSQILKIQGEINTIKALNEKIKNGDIKEIEDKISHLKDEIKSIEENPLENLHVRKPDKLGYYLGIAILIFLSIYLWIFYSSATYSAFFREIDYTKNIVFNSIFYANSMAESLQIGFAAFLLTIVSPFIFIALGYLVHKFNEFKTPANYAKTIALILITFIFDCIIAYEITKKIFEAWIIYNPEAKETSYSVALAVGDVNFWLIIFAGFVVYIVWGLVLSFISDSYKNLDSVKAALRNRKEKIKDLEEQKAGLNNKIQENNVEIAKKEGEVAVLRSQIGAIPFNRKEFEKIVTEFCAGWLKYMTHAKHTKEEMEEIELHTNKFLENVKSDLIAL